MRHASTDTLIVDRGASSRGPLLWIAAIGAFLLLTLAAALSADAEDLPGRAQRSDAFSAAGPIRSLAVENVSGDIAITAGSSFSARVDITVKASGDKAAQRALLDTHTSFQNENGELVLTVEQPGTRVSRGRGKRGWHIHSDWDDHDIQIEAKCTITVPAGASLDVTLVNGGITTKGMEAGQELSTVNGNIAVTSARGELKAHSVNGNVSGVFTDLPRTSDVDVESVNGNITLRLPAKAGFHFSARTMSGDIVSTFPFPRRDGEKQKEELAAEKEKVRGEKEKLRFKIKEKERERREHEKKGDDDSIEVELDLAELERSLAEMERDLAGMSRDIARTVAASLNRSYEESLGGGGANVHCTNLNGKIALLAEGTDEKDARSLVPSRSARILTVPPGGTRGHLTVLPPAPPRAPQAPLPPAPPNAPEPPKPPKAPKPPKPPKAPVMVFPADEEEGSIVQGDVSGDFYSSLPQGDITLGNVSGKVKISTQSGQIRVVGAGKGAELFTSGGDISIESVNGDLKATTNGGDVHAGTVSGSATLTTSGGDVLLRGSGGPVIARTGGGDVTLFKVRGSVHAQSSGGSLTCEITIAAPREDSDLGTSGGDVTLTLPANVHAEVSVRVTGVDPDGDYIVSDFPELTVEKRRSSQAAEAKLGGGGPRISVRSSSGRVTIRKGPGA